MIRARRSIVRSEQSAQIRTFSRHGQLFQVMAANIIYIGS